MTIEELHNLRAGALLRTQNKTHYLVIDRLPEGIIVQPYISKRRILSLSGGQWNWEMQPLTIAFDKEIRWDKVRRIA
jgi:hypothetical protein